MKGKRLRLTPENIFEKPPYKSILNLLIEFQDKEFQGKKGLKPIHFRYALEKGYKNSNKYLIKSNVRKLEKFFGYQLNNLIRTGKIVPDCITSRQNLSKFLNNLKHPPINAIESNGDKQDVRYIIKKEFYYEGIRIQNKRVIDYFYPNEIKRYSSKLDKDGPYVQIIYGLPPEIYEKFTNKEKEDIEKCIKKIEKEFLLIGRKIEESLQKLRNVDGDKRIKIFLNDAKSEEIKRLLKEKQHKFWENIHSAITSNSFYKGLWFMETPDANKMGKTIFYQSLGWIFDVPEGDGKRYISIVYPNRDNLDRFIRDFEIGPPRELTEREMKSYCKAWSEHFFSKDYELSLSDINEILSWGWENRTNLTNFWVPSLALSVYKENVPNPIPENNPTT